MGDKPGVLQAQTGGRGVLSVETVTISLSLFSPLIGRGPTKQASHWLGVNEQEITQHQQQLNQQQHLNSRGSVCQIYCWFYFFPPILCFPLITAEEITRHPPATKFSRLMDANIDGSGLARNQLFQNQNIHYQQTTGWGVGAHLVQRTKAWRQKITFMLFTREPIDILLLTPVKYAGRLIMKWRCPVTLT